MKKYYISQTFEKSEECRAVLNNDDVYPVRGLVNGQPAPDNAQKTTQWADKSVELLTGEWGVLCIPQIRLDAIGYPLEARAAFIASYGQDIRELSNDDFVITSVEI